MTQEEKKELRRKFAGMAMQGMLSDADTISAAIDAVTMKSKILNLDTTIALNAIGYADALVKELEKVERTEK